MNIHTLLYIMLIVSITTNSCKLSTKLWNGGDTEPPILQEFLFTKEHVLELYFNENIEQNPTFRIAGTYTDIVSNITVEQTKMSIDLQNIIAGKTYSFESIVQDTAGNSVLIIDNFYGYNARLPDMLISEFTCEGSKNNGDKIELAVLSDGNTAGMVLQEGLGNNYTIAIHLPSLEVKKDDYIVVHLRPSPSKHIKNELQSKSESQHRQSYDNAWDLYSTLDKGISNTNASLVLLSHPKGKIIDAVLYSTKKNDMNKKYYGFGSRKSYQWAQMLVDTGAWNKAQHTQNSHDDIATPSLAINPKDSSTTRSISRSSNLKDTNTKKDWHITPTRGATFGEINNNEKH